MFNIAQSFYIDPNIVNKASVVFLTSIDLYFKFKPSVGKTYTGIDSPGVMLHICEVRNGSPILSNVNPKHYSRKEYSEINISDNASSSTKFTFKIPVPLNSSSEYAFIVSYDSNEPFVLWKNTAGEVDIITGVSTKVSSGKVDGNYYEITNGSSITPRNDIDLKFKINVAKFTTNSSNSFVICNDSYEFLKLSAGTLNNNFIGGEYVYVQQANAVGNVTVSSSGSNVSGTGTDFGNTTSASFTDKISNNDLIIVANSTVTQVRKVNVVTNTTFLNVTSSFSISMTDVKIRTFERGIISIDSTSNNVLGTNTSFDTILASGDYILISDGTDGNSEIRQVVSVTNSSFITLDVAPSFTNSTAGYYISATGKVDTFKNYHDYVTLYNSNANSTVYFQTNTILKGVDSLANGIIGSILDVPISKFTPLFNVIAPAGTDFNVKVNFANSSYSKSSNNLVVSNLRQDKNTGFSAVVASRTNEVLNPANLFANSKSINANLTFSTTNQFVSPYVVENNCDFAIQQYFINNDSTNETYANGSAYSKYISKPITLEPNQVAEDLFVYSTAYMPSNTNIEVYAKFLSEEDGEFLNNKNWTKLNLSIPTGSVKYSSDTNPNDFIDISFVVPNYHTGTEVTSGTFQTTSACNVITGSYSTVNTDIRSGDLVRVYNPTFPNTYFVEMVTASNTTTITVSETISNSDVVGSGLKIEKITDKNSAYLDNQNFNILRYYNKANAKYDGYKQMAIKIVLKADNHYKVPRVLNYRAIAVSA